MFVLEDAVAILSRCKVHQRLRSIGKSGFRFEIRIFDFAIKREIRTRFLPPRNSSSRWISIKKSKCGFHGFHFYRSIAKSEKGFAKLLAVFFLLIMRAHARPLFLRKVFQVLFRKSQSNGKDENLKIDI